jgi:hypothetical protein
MKLEVFSYLKIEDKKAGRLVCKDWEFILDEDFLFSYFLSDDTSRWALSSKKVIEKLTAENLRRSLTISSTRSDLSTTNELVIREGVSSVNVRKLLHNCPNIWHLEVLQPNMQTLLPLGMMRKVFPMDNLSELVVS